MFSHVRLTRQPASSLRSCFFSETLLVAFFATELVLSAATPAASILPAFLIFLANFLSPIVALMSGKLSANFVSTALRICFFYLLLPLF